jgi:cyclase
MLTLNHFRDKFGCYRFNVGAIGKVGVCHDRRRVAVDENDAVSLFAQHLAGLRTRIIEFACLPDDDGARPYDENGLEICTLRQGEVPVLVGLEYTKKGIENKRSTLLDCERESAYTQTGSSQQTHTISPQFEFGKGSIVLPAFARTVIVVLLLFTATLLHAQSFVSPHFRLEQLAPRVYAAIAKDEGGAGSNSGLVDLGDKTVVFDSFLSPAAAKDLLKAVDALGLHPVEYVVNSHFHNDHIRGNQVFAANVTIISTAKTRASIERVEPKQITWEIQNAQQLILDTETALADEPTIIGRRDLQIMLAYYRTISESHAQLRTRLPNQTFTDRISLHGTARSVDIIAMDGGHTSGDCVMILPDEHIAFVGDLVSVGMHPYLADGRTDDWVSSLTALEKLPVGVLVPGHGTVGQRAEISLMKEYLQSIRQAVSEMIISDKPESEASAQPIPPLFETWAHRAYFSQNIRTLLHETISGTAGR